MGLSLGPEGRPCCEQRGARSTRYIRFLTGRSWPHLKLGLLKGPASSYPSLSAGFSEGQLHTVRVAMPALERRYLSEGQPQSQRHNQTQRDDGNAAKRCNHYSPPPALPKSNTPGPKFRFPTLSQYIPCFS